MDLDAYFKSPGALTVAQLRDAIGAKSSQQIRQWRYGYADRAPSPANCAAIERATKGAVTVEALRPELAWGRIKDKSWPHPAGRPVHEVSTEAA